MKAIKVLVPIHQSLTLYCAERGLPDLPVESLLERDLDPSDRPVLEAYQRLMDRIVVVADAGLPDSDSVRLEIFEASLASTVLERLSSLAPEPLELSSEWYYYDAGGGHCSAYAQACEGRYQIWVNDDAAWPTVDNWTATLEHNDPSLSPDDVLESENPFGEVICQAGG